MAEEVLREGLRAAGIEAHTWQDYVKDRPAWAESGFALQKQKQQQEQQEQQEEEEHPRLVAVPKSHEEVRLAVKACVEAEEGRPELVVSIGVAGTGHIGGAGPFHGSFLLLDLSHLRFVVVDKEKRVLRCGGGAQLREVCARLRGCGSIVPVGTGPMVGITGFAVHGGVSGYTSRFVGLGCASIDAVDMVLADGSELVGLRAEGQSAPADLFWATRGAGAALGVVTSVSLKLSPVQEHVRGGKLVLGLPSGQALRAQAFRAALSFLRDVILPRGDASCEVVATAQGEVLVFTLVVCSADDALVGLGPYPALLRAAMLQDLQLVTEDGGAPAALTPLEDSLDSPLDWYGIATGLYDVIGGMKGSPLGCLQQGGGYDGVDVPDEYLDWICAKVYTDLPWADAPQSIIEVRTLGGAARDPNLASGNASVDLFWDQIILWDAEGEDTATERLSSYASSLSRDSLANPVASAGRARFNMSATHNQSDTPLPLQRDDSAAAALLGGRGHLDRVRQVKHQVDPRNRFCSHQICGL